MLKLKNILVEQGNVKSFTIQTPAPKQVLDIVRATTPRGTAFILKSTDVLGEAPDPATLIELLKLDDRFGQNSVWATDEFVYIFGPDTGKAQRKYKMTVMIVPKYYIYDLILGIEKTDETKVAMVDSFLGQNIAGNIGSSNIYLQEDLDILSAKIAPMLDKEIIKSQQAEIDKLKQALATKSEPAAQTQNVVSLEPSITAPETPAVTPSENKAQALLAKLKDAPIKLNTTSDDVKYIQDLMYRIGMADENLGEKNDITSWAAFRDAKPQYGTYGTRTKNFIDVIKKAAGVSTTNSDITAEVLQLFLDAGKPLGITESRKKYHLDTFIQEQFNITADIDKEVMGKTTSASTTKTKNSLKTNTDIKSTPSENEVYSIWSLSNSDPWEYRFASLTNDLGKAVWWTRKKGATKWINLKTSMSPEKYNQIEKKLDTAVDEKSRTATYRWSNEKLSTTTINTITAQDIKDSNEMDKIWNNMLDVFVYNPDKYFKRYSGWFNDREDRAADWVIKAYNEAWGSALTRLAKSKSTYIQKNVKAINNVVNYIANELIRQGDTGSITPRYYYVNKGDTKWTAQDIKFRWSYM